MASRIRPCRAHSAGVRTAAPAPDTLQPAQRGVCSAIRAGSASRTRRRCWTRLCPCARAVRVHHACSRASAAGAGVSAAGTRRSVGPYRRARGDAGGYVDAVTRSRHPRAAAVARDARGAAVEPHLTPAPAAGQARLRHRRSRVDVVVVAGGGSECHQRQQGSRRGGSENTAEAGHERAARARV